jgi:hypothetical protein
VSGKENGEERKRKERERKRKRKKKEGRKKEKNKLSNLEDVICNLYLLYYY